MKKLIFILIFHTNLLFAQEKLNFDSLSLQKYIKTCLDLNKTKPDSAIYCIDLAIENAAKIKNKRLLIQTKSVKADFLLLRKEYEKAYKLAEECVRESQQASLKNYFFENIDLQREILKKSPDLGNELALLDKRLKYALEIKYDASVSRTFLEIGAHYYRKSAYTQAMENFQKSLEIAEKINDKSLAASAYTNIGNIFGDEKDYEAAVKYYMKALEMKESSNEKRLIGTSYNNIGIAYKKLGKLENALEFYHKALMAYRQNNDKGGISRAYNNIGITYKDRKMYDSALFFYEKSLEIKKELDDKLVWSIP